MILDLVGPDGLALEHALSKPPEIEITWSRRQCADESGRAAGTGRSEVDLPMNRD